MEPFAGFSHALNQSGIAHPVLLVDKERFTNNLKTLRLQNSPQNIRLVVKSIPCPFMLDYGMRLLGTKSLMCFHGPFLSQILDQFPEADILLGKPLPVAAAVTVIQQMKDVISQVQQVQWLIDTEERLDQYLTLAKAMSLELKVSVEIDVGMGRGGVQSPELLQRLLSKIYENPSHLHFTGLMGYDAHAAKAGRGIAKAVEKANERYNEFKNIARFYSNDLVFNGAGSPTHLHHGLKSPLNDISIGSALLKPSDFDLPHLEAYEPACWIATPILKRVQSMPSGKLAGITGRRSVARFDRIFVYGGRWMANPVWPDNMQYDDYYGHSSNQQMLAIPKDSIAKVDDWAFFRPTQSEAVLLQFGDLCWMRGDSLDARWPTLKND